MLRKLLHMECITDDHLKRLRDELENEKTFSHPELYITPENEHGYILWNIRYGSLDQDTQFFKNLVSLFCLRWKCISIEEWHMKADLQLVPQEVADFEIAYCYMNPCRWYSHDYRLENDYRLESCADKIFKWNEWMSWSIVNERFTEISNKHLPICSVDDFISFKMSM